LRKSSKTSTWCCCAAGCPTTGGKTWHLVWVRGNGGERPAVDYRRGSTRAWVKLKGHEGVFIARGIRDVDAFDGGLVGEQFHYRAASSSGVSALPMFSNCSVSLGCSPRGRPRFWIFVRCAAVWLEPRLRAEVTYAEIMAGRVCAPGAGG